MQSHPASTAISKDTHDRTNNPIHSNDSFSKQSHRNQNNILQLKNSMNNIQKMIERSRTIIYKSKSKENRSENYSPIQSQHPNLLPLQHNSTDQKLLTSTEIQNPKIDSQMKDISESYVFKQKPSLNQNNKKTQKIQFMNRLNEATKQLFKSNSKSQKSKSIHSKFEGKIKNSCINNNQNQVVRQKQLNELSRRTITNDVFTKLNKSLQLAKKERNIFYGNLNSSQLKHTTPSTKYPISFASALRKNNPQENEIDSNKFNFTFSPLKVNRNNNSKCSESSVNSIKVFKEIKLKVQPKSKFTHRTKQPNNLAIDLSSIVDKSEKTLDRDNILICDEEDFFFKNKFKVEAGDQSFQKNFKTEYSANQESFKDELNYSQNHEINLPKKIFLKKSPYIPITATHKKMPCNKEIFLNQISSKKKSIQNISKIHSESKQKVNLDLSIKRQEDFLLKIKKYGFVQRYLTENQIISMYDKFKSGKMPENKWPLMVVDEVYKKMKQIKQ